MSAVDVVDDLITLQQLSEHEDDPVRRRSLDAVRRRLANRDRGAKVSDAARALGVSAPTVRSWIEAGVLHAVAGATPVRVDVLSLATVKRAVDLVREHSNDRHLLADVMRLLRDEAALAGGDARSGLEDLAAGRAVPVGDDLLEEIAAVRSQRKRKTSGSS